MGRRRWLFTALTAVGLLVATELLLQILALAIPRVDALLSRSPTAAIPPRHIDDSQLGHRPNPAFPEHDRNGFRNAAVPERAVVVALGDSQTYGMGVERDAAWPQQLARLCACPVYNMAYGGYGPLHSWALLDEALELEPTVVVVTLYAGNDLYDAYALSHVQGSFPELRDPSRDAALVAAEKLAPIEPEIERLAPYLPDPPEAGASASSAPRGQAHHGVLREALAERSRLYGLLRAAKTLVLELARSRSTDRPREIWTAQLAETRERPGKELFAFADGRHKTLLTPAYRLLALDLDDPRIAEGERLALLALSLIADELRARDILLRVLLIPTKERVFRSAVEAAGNVPAKLERLYAFEDRLWSDVRAFLAEHDITFIEALPALEQALADGSEPYPITWDSHPTASGQSLLAKLVHDELRRTGVKLDTRRTR